MTGAHKHNHARTTLQYIQNIQTKIRKKRKITSKAKLFGIIVLKNKLI